MTLYLINIAITWVVAAYVTRSREHAILAGRKLKLYEEWVPWAIILLSWCFLYAFRGTTGTDTGGYYRSFKSAAAALTMKGHVSYKRDQIFYIVQYFLAKLFRGRWVPACAIFSLIVYTPILITIRKKSVDVVVACLMFIFCMAYTFGFNGMRQGLSCGLATMAYFLFLREKRYVLYTIFILLAAGFHSATFLIIPLQFVTFCKFSEKRTIAIVLVSIVFYMYMVQLWGGAMDVLEAVGQEKMAKDYAGYAFKRGSSIIRTLAMLVPTAVAIYKRHEIKARFPDFDQDLWLILIGFLFIMLSMKFVYSARIAAYFSTCSIVYMPKLTYAFGQRMRYRFTQAILWAFFFYMLLLMLHGDSQLYPYVPAWESGRW